MADLKGIVDILLNEEDSNSSLIDLLNGLERSSDKIGLKA